MYGFKQLIMLSCCLEDLLDDNQLKWYTSLSAYVNEHEQLKWVSYLLKTHIGNKYEKHL